MVLPSPAAREQVVMAGAIVAGDGIRHTSSGGRQSKQQGPEPPMGLPAAYVGALAVGMLSHLLYNLPQTRHIHCNGDWYRVHSWCCRPETKKKKKDLIWAHKTL